MENLLEKIYNDFIFFLLIIYLLIFFLILFLLSEFRDDTMLYLQVIGT